MRIGKISLSITLGALILIFVIVKSHGLHGLVFPFFLVSGFLTAFGLMAFNAQIQADANPGIEKIEEPDFWFSSIYNAWLYTTDVERWGSYATIMSMIFGTIMGSLLGALLLFSTHASSAGIYESWAAGMFLAGSIALNIVSSGYWKKHATKKKRTAIS
jgi:hypothetical protein